MKLNRRDKAKLSKTLIVLAVLSVLLSFVGWLWHNIWLASTQWLLVAAVLLLFGIYLMLAEIVR